MSELLKDTDIVASIAFAIFIGILIYYRVPRILTSALDRRADRIRAEIEEARRLREEAQLLLAGFERKQKEVEAQTQAIVDRAAEDARLAADEAKAALAASIERRLKNAEDQIANAEKAAVKEVKDRAVSVAVAAAADAIRATMGEDARAAMLDRAIADVGARLN